MLNLVAIFIGGGLGSVTRFGISNLLRDFSMDYPLSTLTVNIIGSFILGFTAALFWKYAHSATPIHHTIRLSITVGFCGGLTTFSTFSWETFDLIKNGEFLLAFLYTLISFTTCLVAISIGAFLSKYV